MSPRTISIFVGKYNTRSIRCSFFFIRCLLEREKSMPNSHDLRSRSCSNDNLRALGQRKISWNWILEEPEWRLPGTFAVAASSVNRGTALGARGSEDRRSCISFFFNFFCCCKAIRCRFPLAGPSANLCSWAPASSVAGNVLQHPGNNYYYRWNEVRDFPQSGMYKNKQKKRVKNIDILMLENFAAKLHDFNRVGCPASSSFSLPSNMAVRALELNVSQRGKSSINVGPLSPRGQPQFCSLHVYYAATCVYVFVYFFCYGVKKLWMRERNGEQEEEDETRGAWEGRRERICASEG